MKKYTTPVHLSDDTVSKLQVLKNRLPLENGSIHTLRLTEEDGIVIPKEEKAQGFHPKHIVIVGCNEKNYYGCVLIQSIPNKNIHSLATITNDFHPIISGNYSFLKAAHDPSYIDCGQIFSFPKDRIIQAKKCKGHLTACDLNAVITRIKNSERIEPVDLIAYGILDL